LVHLNPLLKDLSLNGKIQLATLQLLNKHLADLPAPVIEFLERASLSSGALSSLMTTQSQLGVRREAIRLVAGLYLRGHSGFSALLLNSLADEDCEGMELEGVAPDANKVGVRRQVVDVLNAKLSRKAEQRLLELLALIQVDADGDGWLRAAAYLLLQLNSDTREYDCPIFNYSLGDCVFQKLMLDVVVPAHKRQMTPGFSLDRTQGRSSQADIPKWTSSMRIARVIFY
jgi:hypothetical protein